VKRTGFHSASVPQVSVRAPRYSELAFTPTVKKLSLEVQFVWKFESTAARVKRRRRTGRSLPRRCHRPALRAAVGRGAEVVAAVGAEALAAASPPAVMSDAA
jgi:hypothetical protein